jgi:hypothetical protein
MIEKAGRRVDGLIDRPPAERGASFIQLGPGFYIDSTSRRE